MSEQQQAETEPKAKPKKGKLPMIIVLAVVLGAGGFFGMKMKGGKAAKPEPKLGTMADLPKEFLVPLRGDGSYLRADVALHFIEGFDTAHGLEASMPAIRDAIIRVIVSKSKRDLESLDDIRKLKIEIATAVNEQLAHDEHGSEEKHEEKAEGDKKADKPAGTDTHGHAPVQPKGSGKEAPKIKHPDWDSQTGPVLKVYFTTFATQ